MRRARIEKCRATKLSLKVEGQARYPEQDREQKTAEHGHGLGQASRGKEHGSQEAQVQDCEDGQGSDFHGFTRNSQALPPLAIVRRISTSIGLPAICEKIVSIMPWEQ